MATQRCMCCARNKPITTLTDCQQDADEDDVNTEISAGSHLVYKALKLHVVGLQASCHFVHLLLDVINDGVLTVNLQNGTTISSLFSLVHVLTCTMYSFK